MTNVHLTWSWVNPSLSATAYATADSKPSPVVGSSSMTYGGYAGLDVLMVRVPGDSSGNACGEQSSAASDAAGEVAGLPAPSVPAGAVGALDGAAHAASSTAANAASARGRNGLRDTTYLRKTWAGPGAMIP